MKDIEPTLSITPDDPLNEGKKIAANLKFEGLGDFGPRRVIDQVETIKEKFVQRNALNALLSKLYVSDDLTTAINDIIKNSENDEALKKHLGGLKAKLGV